MELVLVILAAATLAWWAVYAQRGSMWVGCAAFVAVGYVLGPPLWSPKVGPVTFTVDRVLLVGLGATFLWHARAGRLNFNCMTGVDWLLIAALVYFTARCALTPAPPLDGSAVKPWWRLVAAFWVPAALYLSVRTSPPSEKSWRAILWTLAALGGFLALTAYAEVAQQWWAVFPRYIANPAIGTHFGRARGPALNSASLGIMLTACFWAAWMLWPRLSRPAQLAVGGLLILIATAVYFTYTRSTWIGLAAGLAVIPLVQFSRPWRFATVVGIVIVGAVALIAVGDRITNLGRKDTDGSAEHSVYQRASFAVVSARMWRDAPVFGCGFGRFYDLKAPYLADRSQQLELESLRNLDHHNTLLSVLVETGIVGFTLFVGLLTAWTRAAWQLARDAAREPWQRAHGLFALATIIAYLSSALFHDLTLSATEHWLLFLTAGMSLALVPLPRREGLGEGLITLSSYPRQWRQSRSLPTAFSTTTIMIEHEQTRPTVPLFGMTIDALNMPQTVDSILGWCRAPRSGSCRYVVTPNVDHAVMFQSNEKLRQAYADAALVLADGAPVVLAARLLGRALPERVPGSDLAPALFKTAARGSAPLRVFLLGAAPGVAERAAANITARWGNIEIVGTFSPPLGFERDSAENERILATVAAAQPDLLVVGFGAPKQELWVHAHADRLQAKVALCIGATIDFLAGEKRRAPRWMRRVGLEWLHRLSSEPSRLAKRYLRDAWIFPQLVLRDWLRC